MIGFIVELTYPNHKQTTTTCSGTWHVGHAAKSMFNIKNGAQHRTNVKNTRPNTLDAFCSVTTELAAMFFRFTLPASNLQEKSKKQIKKKYKRNILIYCFELFSGIFVSFLRKTLLDTSNSNSNNDDNNDGHLYKVTKYI